MFCLRKLENWVMLWESAHIALGHVPDSGHASPQPWYVITVVPILKMRTWSLGRFKLLVWGHPASKGCNHWHLFCLIQRLTFSSASSCLPSKLRWESRMRPVIDLGSILRDLGDLHATWSLLFLLPNFRWFLFSLLPDTFLLLHFVSWLLSVNIPLLSSSTLVPSVHMYVSIWNLSLHLWLLLFSFRVL